MNLKLLNKPLIKNPALDRILNAVFFCVVIWATAMIAVSGYIYIYGYLPAHRSQQILLDVIEFIQEKEIKAPSVSINDLRIPVELALTAEEKARGLSGRLSLDENRGMLFMFQTAGIYRFWMPNMHFSIDIIWIDSEKRIIGAAENVPPLEDLAKPVWYRPSRPAQYVLEVNAGFVKLAGIRQGDTVVFENISEN